MNLVDGTVAGKKATIDTGRELPRGVAMDVCILFSKRYHVLDIVKIRIVSNTIRLQIEHVYVNDVHISVHGSHSYRVWMRQHGSNIFPPDRALRLY